MQRALLIVVAAITAAQISTPIDAKELQRGWRFSIGDPREGLRPDATRLPASGAIVELPHRVNAPDTPLWYSKRVDLPSGHALFVDADDGAQVFVDGERADQHRRWFIPNNPSSVSRLLVVRVLNNAMQGGLRAVRLAPIAEVRKDALDLGPAPPAFAAVESTVFRRRMPTSTEPCRFTAWADSQGGWQTFAKLVQLMTADAGHFSVGVGDLVNDGSDPAAWRSYVTTLLPLAERAPIVSVAGNHDYDGFYNDLIARHYLALFRPSGVPWFAWTCGMVRFAAIDVNTEFPVGLSAGQQRWLDREAASPQWREARWRVLLVHQPPWSRSWEGYTGDGPVRDAVTTLSRSSLDLVVAGHSHAYEHLVRVAGKRSIHVLITGGAGGGLEAPLSKPADGDGTIILQHHFIRAEVNAERFAVRAINAAGFVIDEWHIER